ncbi:uncharacterized protein LOC107607069 [Arachis ipaensis]|uniref:uncharacterized protein LOC107607069 n=1 Tax=Arachis ipaensis TaxID=130454 RepID=UPI0007AFCA52|nr:uncharacterized protein LOC107607069 [Arachis ipaensis]XP_025664719.1 uncharacterized protein LOC112763203 [Arachis hypogaea]
MTVTWHKFKLRTFFSLVRDSLSLSHSTIVFSRLQSPTPPSLSPSTHPPATPLPSSSSPPSSLLVTSPFTFSILETAAPHHRSTTTIAQLRLSPSSRVAVPPSTSPLSLLVVVAAHPSSSVPLGCAACMLSDFVDYEYAKILLIVELLVLLFSYMTTGRVLADQAAGHGCRRDRGRGRVFSGTPGNFGSSPSTPTTPVTSQVVGLVDQPFIMIANPNYVPPFTVTTPPPMTYQPAAIVMSPPATKAAAPESSHRSEVADTPPPLPIVRLTIWLDGGSG